ncbi:SDR family NAD(P)-dependent oxidoreductase [Allorhodopirellula heiligendammensis]|uniref:3-oxoacyl-[acyl-carrier-protein] reductase FabG n=1 Tax=Allorhodopirellula heiligendammensis TaxID=2714739 RepID=A0A5C6C2N3_9BACT|nr:SDR family oxidoreductase [Allorhodopirellula heiligendammensis]TWU18800.1 3-oxoacyl-[acyl-carrier-protein] reductase FabG [Allorhodopirellula heiligendammensis]
MEREKDAGTVVVLGAARGIGRAVTDAFLDSGCSVVAADVDNSVSRMSRAGVSNRVVDVTCLEQVDELARECVDVSHVVFTVGVGSGHRGFPFWNVPPAEWRRVLDVNLIGAVNVAHTFGPRLAERGSGSILFFASVAGQIGSQTDPPYSASKAALINFTQCAAKDLAPFGVRVNAIAPGMVKTDLNQSVWEASVRGMSADQQPTYEEWAAEKIRRVSPLGRWQELDEIAAMTVFLASDAARNITGQTINIDGGQVMHS